MDNLLPGFLYRIGSGEQAPPTSPTTRLQFAPGLHQARRSDQAW